MWITLIEIQLCTLTPYQISSFRGASTNGKLTGISVLNAKLTVLKKINVLFTIHFCLSKSNYSLDTFLTYLAFNFF